MRPIHADDHPTTAPPRLVAVAEAPAADPSRIPAGDTGTEAATARWWHPASGELSAWGPREVREIDADVSGAVGRMLGHVLTERLHRARQTDPLFAQELAERVTRFTLRGGKRLRARLVWWAARACAGRDPAVAAAALRVGAALELLQTCALVHDDVMDRASLRRGRPALHADVAADHVARAGCERADRFGQSAAILAGDLALAWADDLVAQTPLPDGTAEVVRRLWSDMRTEMVAGQYLDVQGQITGARSLPRALRAACLKSAAYSVERPLALGAAVAGADGATLRRLGDAGRCVGLAFQLRDDLDDVFGDPRDTGKACGGDIREGKPTYLVAVARARAEAAGDLEALAVLERRLGDASLTASGLAQVREVLVATGEKPAEEAKAERLAARGLRHVDGARLTPEGATELRRLLLAVAGARPGTEGHGDSEGAHGGSGARGGTGAHGEEAAPTAEEAGPGHRPRAERTARTGEAVRGGHRAHAAQEARTGEPARDGRRSHGEEAARTGEGAGEGTSAMGGYGAGAGAGSGTGAGVSSSPGAGVGSGTHAGSGDGTGAGAPGYTGARGNSGARASSSVREGTSTPSNTSARASTGVRDGTGVRGSTSVRASSSTPSSTHTPSNTSPQNSTSPHHGTQPRAGEEAGR
ncbi:hypothetical protein GCM10018785_47000 [Streptomyces longispororuber]|uniref:Geranylgeranyl pyrophosphate synthase n=1 Tax=Streptomyces longispororuber TaxID=68230 RepID=A0A918ZXR5_9ACTN|nr:polyprenyl synthetase family protein [Streptomyces longispororuber]GHE73438.1 hypothetical protein GCM10018785_47000 [Streptomyces longispororuber]